MPTLSEILNSRFPTSGLSKAYLALQLDVSEKTIENYINGRREPELEKVIKLSKLLDFSLDELTPVNNNPEQNVPTDNKEAINGKHYLPRAFIDALHEFGNKMDSNLGVILNELRDIYNQQVETRAEVRGYGQRQIYNEVKWDTQEFLSVMAEVGRLTELNLKSDPKLGSKTGVRKSRKNQE